MSNGDQDQEDAKKLHQLIRRSEGTLQKIEAERVRWQEWGKAFTSGMREGAGPTLGDPSDTPGPVKIELAKEPEHPFWSRISDIMSGLAVIISVFGLLFTACQYRSQLEEMNATTIYDVANEGRALSRELNAGTATTGEGISYHFSVYYLQEKGVIDVDLRPLLLLDFCEFTKARPDFAAVWRSVSNYYPVSFRDAVMAFQRLSECTLPDLERVRTEISVWGDE